MATFNNNESGSSVRTKINAAITFTDDMISSGAGAPATTPGAVGYVYVDTTNDLVYMAAGTASSADWYILNNVRWFDAGGSSATARPTSNTEVLVVWTNHGSSDPTNALSHDIIAGPGKGVVSVNTQTGTSYTLVLADAGKDIDMDNASANTVTIPTNASVAFLVGTCIMITQLGAGVTTVQGDTGVTLNGTSAGSEAINNQYAGVTIRKISTDTWIIQGDSS